MTELELLAPARNADIGIAAIDCGADAVYIAGPAFGARQDAGNSMEDIHRLCEYAHKFGVRIFLTLNTILYDSEIPDARRILEEAAEAGVDAVIAQDLAVFEILRTAQNDMEAHASTQCAIRTPEQARFYESLGASRIVLERQLSLDQIRAIREAVSCEIEFFVHGALCVCYSGQCYMSEAVAGRSANRGACVQACRSLYDLQDSSGKILVKDKALLSLKDFNLIERLTDLAEAGVCSFKIEGRLKNISYVRNTVRAYSKALDTLVSAHPDKYRRASFGKIEGGFTPDLRKTFNRGYTELFLDGKRGKWSSMDAPKSAGEEIGTVVSILGGRPSGPGRVQSRFAAAEYGLRPAAAPPKDKDIEVLVRLDNPATTLRNGDGFTFTPKGGGEIRGFRGDVCEGNRIICKEVPGLYVGARLRRNLSVAFEKDIEANLPVRRIPVQVDLAAGSAAGLRPYSAAASPEPERRTKREWTRPGPDGVPAYTIKVKAESEDGRKVEFEVEAGNQEANNVERMEAMFKSQIEKASGIYSFTLSNLDSSGSDGKLPFMPASAINGIRREIAQRLDQSSCEDRPFASLRVTNDAMGKGDVMPETIDYKSNISNNIAREALRRLGAKDIEDAFEMTHRDGAELMRTKYCVRHELGLCPKDSTASGLRMTNGTSGNKMTGDGNRVTPGPLYLVNNGKRYRLGFDCARCEMTVSLV